MKTQNLPGEQVAKTLKRTKSEQETKQSMENALTEAQNNTRNDN
jgi:hypothetical protein